MNKKLISATLVWFLLVTLLPAATLQMSQDRDKEGTTATKQFGLTMPSAKPAKPQANYDENFRKSKRTEDFFEERDDVIAILRELTTMVSTADEKELRRNQAKIAQLVKKYKKAKSEFYKEAKKLRAPWDKEYEKYLAEEKRLKTLADNAAEKGDNKNATKFEQQIAKFSGKMESLKTNIDIVNFYLFFDEEAPLAKYLDIANPPNAADKMKKKIRKQDN